MVIVFIDRWRFCIIFFVFICKILNFISICFLLLYKIINNDDIKVKRVVININIVVILNFVLLNKSKNININMMI